MSEETKDVVKKEQAAPPAEIEKDNLGFGKSADNEDLLIVPRATLMQSGSPALKDPGAACKFGDYVNSVTKQVVDTVFIPIAFSTNWIRFNPKKADEPGFDPNFDLSVIIWRAKSKLDPAYVDAEANFGPNGERPLAVQFLNFLSYFPESGQLLMVSFSKGSFKTGKELFNMIRSQDALPFAYKYKLGHVTKTGPSKDDYLMMTVRLDGKNEGELYDKVKGMAKEFSAKVDNVVAHEEGAGEEIPF